MKHKAVFLSVVIPVFNEEKRVKKIADIVSYLKKQPYPWEIIVVNDGSTDRTIKILKELRKKLRFSLISYTANTGKGFAVKTGMLQANGKFRLFLDVDLSTPISEIEKFLPYMEKYDILVGSRKLRTSSLAMRQPILREYLGKIFTLLSQYILNMYISDFTCGFKIFSEKSAKHIFSRQKIEKWGFDPEILYIGKLKRYSIKEIPVFWKDDPRTKVKIVNAVINSLMELILIRINAKKGLYH